MSTQSSGSASYVSINDANLLSATVEAIPEINVLPASSYAFFLSQDAKARKPSPIRGLFPLEQTPGVISLLAGKPNDAMFPFTNIQFSVPCPDSSEQMLLKVDDDLLSMGLQSTGGRGRRGGELASRQGHKMRSTRLYMPSWIRETQS